MVEQRAQAAAEIKDAADRIRENIGLVIVGGSEVIDKARVVVKISPQT